MGVEYFLINPEKKTGYELGKGLNSLKIVDFLSQGFTLEEAINGSTYPPGLWNTEEIKGVADDIRNTIGLSGLVPYNDYDDIKYEGFTLVGSRMLDADIGKKMFIYEDGAG